MSVAEHIAGLGDMITPMKIYTKTGDDGTTGLIGGQRVGKDDPQIDCFGSVDELNAAIGWAAVGTGGELLKSLRLVQNELFIIGSHLASPDGKPPSWIPVFEDSAVDRLEMEIDSATERLPPLRDFIVPGGCETSARLHLTRTICRRVERVLVAFSHDRPVAPIMLTYLNRLSDWLFLQARLANQQAGLQDVPWIKS
jgi:cob(I)alamin adenosyltransferase